MKNWKEIFVHSSYRMILLFSCVVIVNVLLAQTKEDCLMCHEETGKTIKKLNRSVHKNVNCILCHKDAGPDLPHGDKLNAVNCGGCHKEAQLKFEGGIHGQAFKLKAPYAPDCKECHGTHDIISKAFPQSRTYKMNIPFLCGKCHKEGASVARLYTEISQKNILEHYSEGIHGKGLFKSGLLVTAVCSDCHESHLILPKSSPNSSIANNKIAATCMKCHARIEEAHQKVIKSELWEKKPGAIPACSDCHPPHKIKIENIAQTVSNQVCLKCHNTDDAFKMVSGKKVSLKINIADLTGSSHKNIPCTKCHVDVNTALARPCESTKRKVDCSNCHIKTSNEYFASGHGQAYLVQKKNAPFCTDCHGTHKIKTRYDDTSPTYRMSIPNLCGKCHQTNGKANKQTHLKEVNAFFDYSKSVHGEGLSEKGLSSVAVCTDCHTTHSILKESDTKSSVHPENIPSTCAKCHKGIYDQYIKSDHSILKSDGKQIYPSCANCHSAHTITEIDKDKFMNEVTIQCGSCHKKLAETYKETFHGKSYQLGDLKAARCSDCHGSHNILKANNPESAIGSKHIVATCRKCHRTANKEFTSFLTHSTHNDKPVLKYTFWAMTSLLLGVFGFFGLHTLLWIPRSITERKKKHHKGSLTGEKVYFKRFSRSQRVTHIFVILSFILLALTGMTLKFSYMEWARDIAKIFGGVHTARIVHRIAAIITFGYFAFHLYSLVREKTKKQIKWKDFIFGSNSLCPNKQDIKDLIATVKWFVGKGTRPSYGRWTYWEKFDYLAVFWGVAIIGFSGLILWFPVTFTKFLPGWAINVAQIIHSDEALLAVGFIFTIHFFNTHLRPESFPMDTVIFTGHVLLEEYKNDRVREYEELEKSGKLKDVTVQTEISSSRLKLVKTFGFIFLSFGIILVILIIYSLIVGH